MDLTLIGHEDRYPVEQLLLSLFSVGSQGQALSKLSRGQKYITASARLTIDGKVTHASRRLPVGSETVRLRRRILQQAMYLAALPHLPDAPAWGALAGVRPTKISTKALLEGESERSVRSLLRDVYFVSPQRVDLALDCSRSTVEAIRKADSSDISLYIGIPFCPTRCAYCSFVSRSIGSRTELIEPYLDALCREIEVTGHLLAESGKTIRSLSLGGGTPTTLTDEQMRRLLTALQAHFDLSRCIEFTVEGGRPDTLTLRKLQTIHQFGADRVSINPQTMIGSVLHACGRPHTPQDVAESYRWAREAGFASINMDLIAGLPTDTVEGFQKSVDELLALSPENITVHTLALKKGADLFESKVSLPSREDVARMVDYASSRLRSCGYQPYYLYRQKYMSGSFENVGWSKPGTDCLYNIYMMEELHTILSLGGGGMNKVTLPDGRLQRFHNPKFPEEYIAQLENVLHDKEELFRLMKGSL